MKTSFSKDDPAINEHSYCITENQYNEDTHNIYNLCKTETYNVRNSIHTDEHCYHKKTNVNNNVTGNMSKTTLSNNELVVNLKILLA